MCLVNLDTIAINFITCRKNYSALLKANMLVILSIFVVIPWCHGLKIFILKNKNSRFLGKHKTFLKKKTIEISQTLTSMKGILQVVHANGAIIKPTTVIIKDHWNVYFQYYYSKTFVFDITVKIYILKFPLRFNQHFLAVWKGFGISHQVKQLI